MARPAFTSLLVLGGALLLPTVAPTIAHAAMQPPAQPAAPAPGAAPAGPPAGFPPPPAPVKLGPPVALKDRPAALAPFFTLATPSSTSVDEDGFIRRWLVLEPVSKPNRTNQGFTSAYVRDAFAKAAIPGKPTDVPRDAQTVKIGTETLMWHALDSQLFDAKLFNFAQGLNKTTYGVIFWVTTVVEADQDIANAHLAVGSNSASIWWVNGVETTALFGDRRMVMDDGVSPRVTLKKGRNVIRAAIINGPGLSDFCARFVDDAGQPIKAIKVSLR